MDLTPEQLVELQAKAARADQLQQALEDAKDRITAARKIQTGYNTLKETNKDAAAYLDALAKGESPAPFWSETPVEDDFDADANSKLEQRLTRMIEEKLSGLGSILNQKFEAVARPVLSMQAQRAESAVQAWAHKKYPDLDWDDFKGKAKELAGSRGDLLEDEHGLQTLVRSYWADQAEQSGFQRAQSESTARRQLESAILLPDFNSGDQDVDGDVFEGVEPTDMTGMFERMLERDLSRRG